MAELKITIDQLKNYLGTGVKALTIFEGHKLEREMTQNNMINFINMDTEAKLMFYRLSDLDKFIPELGFVPKDEFYILYGGGVSEIGKSLWKEIFTDNIRWSPIETISFGVVQKLFQWHFWPFGEEYFNQGLVIDKLKQ